jgi:hypothetical protein
MVELGLMLLAAVKPAVDANGVCLLSIENVGCALCTSLTASAD